MMRLFLTKATATELSMSQHMRCRFTCGEFEVDSIETMCHFCLIGHLIVLSRCKRSPTGAMSGVL